MSAAASPLLRVRTPAAWVAQACAAPALLLIDHANCEKKAASTALSLMFAYAEDLELTDRMSHLAREELRHYEQVARLMHSLGVVPQRLAPGRYASRLRSLIARIEPQRELDLMICGAFIEARSCERFGALAPAIGGAIGALFQGLHAAEARHQRVYLDLARRAARRAGLALGPRVEEFAALEAELITSNDAVFRFHSGTPQCAPQETPVGAPKGPSEATTDGAPDGAPEGTPMGTPKGTPKGATEAKGTVSGTQTLVSARQ